MTARRDPDRQIRAFLEDNRMELPAHAYDAVRAEIDHTRQRVVIGPWSEPQLYNAARFALLAAALVGVAVIGISILPRDGGIGGPTAPTPTPVALPISDNALPLVAGTYVVFDPAVSPVRMTVTVPSGWQTLSSFLFKARGATFDETTTTLSHWRVQNVYSDPCHSSTSLLDPPVGSTVDDLANALADQVGRDATEPVDVTIDGYRGKKVELSVPTDFNRDACDNGDFKPWSWGPFPGDYGGFLYGPGQRDTVYIVDVAGERVLIETTYLPGTPSADRAELQAIFESIRLEATPTPTPPAEP